MNAPRIDSYRFGKIVVDGQTFGRDLILLPGGVLPEWWRADGHRLQPSDLGAVIEAQPQVLVVGLGAYGRMRVTEETIRVLDAEGIELVAKRTKEACQVYNTLSQTKATAAALHLTC